MRITEAEVATMKEAGIRFLKNGRSYWSKDEVGRVAEVHGYDKSWEDIYEKTWHIWRPGRS